MAFRRPGISQLKLSWWYTDSFPSQSFCLCRKWAVSQCYLQGSAGRVIRSTVQGLHAHVPKLPPKMNPAKRLKAKTAPFYLLAADKQGHDFPLVKKMKVKYIKRAVIALTWEAAGTQGHGSTCTLALIWPWQEHAPSQTQDVLCSSSQKGNASLLNVSDIRHSGITETWVRGR